MNMLWKSNSKSSSKLFHESTLQFHSQVLIIASCTANMVN